MIRVLSNVNIGSIARLLEERFPNEPITLAPFDQIAQELLDPTSPAHTYEPRFVLIFLDSSHLFSQDELDFRAAISLAESRLAEVLEPVRDYLARRPTCRVLLNTLAYPAQIAFHSAERNLRFHLTKIDAYNVELSRWKSEHGVERLIICDWAARTSRVGTSVLYDERFWYLGRIPLSARGMVELADLYTRAISALSGIARKVLLVDLDNTLWGGVIGEDGVEGIALGEDGLGKVHRDFQTRLKALKEQGTLLAIVSKNNESDVEHVFLRHPMMVLKTDDFVARKVSWSPKTEAIADLSKELSLGLDSFVLIDDSPVERELVRQALPQVCVPEFPRDPYTLNSWFEDVAREHFDTLVVTEEDTRRTELYRADIERQSASRSFTSLDDFYRGLDMKMRVWEGHREQTARLAQLTQRTNQFNLTTRRYDTADFERLFSSSDVRVYDIELSDRYGSNGIVGLIIARLSERTAEIDTFLMSCRVIGRKVEHTFFAYVVNDLHKLGIDRIKAEYVPTAKNAPAKGLLDELGFQNGEDPRSFHVRPMEYPDYITIAEGES